MSQASDATGQPAGPTNAELLEARDPTPTVIVATAEEVAAFVAACEAMKAALAEGRPLPADGFAVAQFQDRDGFPPGTTPEQKRVHTERAAASFDRGTTASRCLTRRATRFRRRGRAITPPRRPSCRARRPAGRRRRRQTSRTRSRAPGGSGSSEPGEAAGLHRRGRRP